MAGQADGCFEARSHMVRVATAGIEYQRTSFIKEAFDFRFLKRMIKIRRAIGYRLARQFLVSSSIFQHYMDTQLSFDRPRGADGGGGRAKARAWAEVLGVGMAVPLAVLRPRTQCCVFCGHRSLAASGRSGKPLSPIES